MASYLEKARRSPQVSRRGFVKASAAATAALAVAGLAGCSNKVEPVKDSTVDGVQQASLTEGTWIPAACWHNCGGRCLNKVLVKDGVVVRQKTDDTHEDSVEFPQIRACLRGRSQQQHVFGADRIKYPLKRKHWEPGGGQKELRGIDEWERISWDEAIGYVADELKKVYETYGPTGVLIAGYGTGQNVRLISYLGGAVAEWDSASHGTYLLNVGSLGLPHMGVGPGAVMCTSANDRFDLKNSETIVLYGCNPAWASAGNRCKNFLEAKEAGTEFVYVGPSYNPSASLLEARWIRVRPGTDVSFLLAVAYTMVTQDDPQSNPLVDWDFIEKYTVGFTADTMPEEATLDENLHDYLLGAYDGVPKTPEWASPICGTPVEDIEWFAQLVGKEHKVALLHSFAAARNKGAEDFPQMLMTIGALGGHMGKSGHACGSAFGPTAGDGGPSLVMPGQAGLTPIPNTLGYFVAGPDTWNAVLTGRFFDTGHNMMGSEQGFPPPVEREVDIHLICHDDSGAALQSRINIPGGIEAHRKVDFVFTQAYTMTTNAKYADIILPACTQWEKKASYFQMIYPGRDFEVFPSKVVDPLYESKSDYDIIVAIAERMGIDPKAIFDFDETQQWFNVIVGSTVMKEDGTGYEPLVTVTQDDIDEWGVQGQPQEGRIGIKELLDKGIYQVERHEGDPYTFIAYKSFVDDPAANPLPSHSGKFEIYCQWKGDWLAASPRGDTPFKPYPTYQVPIEGYETTFDDWDNQVKGDYPYLFFTPHYLRRAHTTLDNVPWLREAFENPVFISAQDAKEKGVVTGDTVLVQSRYGKVLRIASVTETLMPGVLALPHGSWVDIDQETGCDKGGADNVLCGPVTSNSGVSGYNNYNINFEKYDAEQLLPDVEWPQRIVDAE